MTVLHHQACLVSVTHMLESEHYFQSKFCPRRLDCRVSCEEDMENVCCLLTHGTSFSGGSMMVWGGSNLTGKMKLISLQRDIEIRLCSLS